jgi:hypothetical protein
MIGREHSAIDLDYMRPGTLYVRRSAAEEQAAAAEKYRDDEAYWLGQFINSIPRDRFPAFLASRLVAIEKRLEALEKRVNDTSSNPA